ncbi:MAG: hypothetical protein JW920_08020, partial [Deltaproteobacteria bacterium]|nr:hypothetical protein [Deltaproteobacteria bacterium]
QGSRSGGLIAQYLTRLGIVGIKVMGNSPEQLILVIDREGKAMLNPVSFYGKGIVGTGVLAERIYQRHGEDLGLALTDPSTSGFLYNAVVCNTRNGIKPNRSAARSTSIFGHNGLVGIAVASTSQNKTEDAYDRKKLSEVLRKIHKAKRNINLAGDASRENPLLGGTYGAAAKIRLDNGHGLTNLFRSANVPDEFYQDLLPETLASNQIDLSEACGIKITRHSCLPGCPNKCVQSVLIRDDSGDINLVKAGEWETYQGLINLGIFKDLIRAASEVMEHSNKYAYDHIEALVTIAALALVSEIKQDTGVRYGDNNSIMSALKQAAQGRTELGQLIRKGAAAVEAYYGVERHFTVGGHALPFHNGRSLLQTGIGLSWTYGRHGEACAGPGRHNFLGEPYDPADHNLDPKIHVLNTIHGITLYGALDELGSCFFIGPSIDTLVDYEMIFQAMGLDFDPKKQVKDSAQTILAIHQFNDKRGIHIQPLPRIFYEQTTYGNKQSPEDAVKFNVPFDIIQDYGIKVLDDVATGKTTIPDSLLEKSRRRYL